MKSSKPNIFIPETLREMAYNFQPSRILLTGVELGIFTTLNEKSKSSEQVAKELKTDPRATDRLMNALSAMGLISKRAQKFSNSPAAAQFLVKGKPEYLAGMMHTVSLWKTWSTLTEAVKTGASVVQRPAPGERGEDWTSAFIAAMHARASKEAPQVAAKMDLFGVNRVLDVGGGSGAYAMAFAQAKENLTATVFDLPAVIPLAKKYVKEAGLLDRVDFRMGNYLTDDLGEGYDMVFLSAIVHSNSDRENRLLMKKCVKALNKDGRVIVQDFLMERDRVRPSHGAFFALNMLVGTPTGDTYTEPEIRSWMKDAGLSWIIRKDTGFPADQIIGRKRK